MKSALFLTLLTLLIVSTPYLPNTFAQDYIRWELPADAKARIGKGYIYEIQYAPDGTQLAVATSIGVWLYDARTGKELNLLTDHTSSVRSVAFSPDGKTLASGGDDGNIHLWNPNRDEYLKTLTGHGDIVRSLVFSSDGKTLASGSADGNIHLWDGATGEHANTLFTADMEFVTSLAFSPDGKTLASAEGRRPIDEVFVDDDIDMDPPDWSWDNVIRLWDTNTGEKKETLTGHTDIITDLVFSPDGKTLASGSWDRTTRLWDTNIGEEKKTLTGHTGIVASLAFNPDGLTLVGTSWETIHLWDAITGEHLKTLTESIVSEGQGSGALWSGSRDVYPLFAVESMDALRSLAFGPDVGTLTSASGGEIHLWDTDTGTLLKTLTKHTDIITSLALSPNGTMLASGSSKEIHLWDTDTGTLLKTLTGPQRIISTLVFGPDGSTLASVSWQEDYIIDLWDVVTEAHLKTFTAQGDFVHTLQRGDSLWDTPNNAPLQMLTSNGYDWHRWALSTNGRIRAYGRANGNIDLSGTTTHTHLKTFMGHPLDIYYLAFSADGRTLVSSSADGTMLLWDLTSVPIEKIPGDVNTDGVVNIQDLTLVAANFGQTGPNVADINRDNIVNIADLVLVAGVIGAATAAPSVQPQALAMLTTTAVQKWLTQAYQLRLTDATSQRGIRFLEQLLAALIPKETTVLPNYPNPFNPETWTPYQLAKSADVTLTIYAVNGQVIRQLALGHQPIGIYQARNRAAHWDGKNELGEAVTSGIYFYTLTAGEFKTTRKMVIRR